MSAPQKKKSEIKKLKLFMDGREMGVFEETFEFTLIVQNLRINNPRAKFTTVEVEE